MKKIFFVLSALACLVLAGCNQNSYSSQRNAEDKLIENFIARQHINVLTEEPADDYQWAENDYLLVPGYDDLYFHLRNRGDSLYIEDGDTTRIDPIEALETVVMRYFSIPVVFATSFTISALVIVFIVLIVWFSLFENQRKNRLIFSEFKMLCAKI